MIKCAARGELNGLRYALYEDAEKHTVRLDVGLTSAEARAVRKPIDDWSVEVCV